MSGELERTARTLAEITADAMRANCGAGDCWAEPGRPCSCAPGVHLPRYQRAWRKGLISSGDLAFVLASVIASEVPGAVIPGEALAGAA